jgi:S1-C subfamily serine protease
LPVKSGVLVSEVYPGEAADAAGLRGGRQRVRVGRGIYFLGGDIIYELDEQRINTLDDVNRVVNQHRPGETISAVVYRGSQRLTVKMKLTEKPANPQ